MYIFFFVTLLFYCTQIVELKTQREASSNAPDYQVTQLQKMIEDLQVRQSQERTVLNELVCSVTDDVASHVKMINEKLRVLEQEAKQIKANISK